MPVDLTSPWIPLSIIMLLGLFMIRQFIQERQAARVLALEQASAPAAPPAVETAAEGSPVVAVAPAPVAAPSASAPEKPARKKMKLRWRTAWIWLPFLVGFFGQAYLSFVKPMLENAG
ncbi:MAG: hypothetical protein U0942_09050 [Parvibaculum sp.]|uniref:hypothetical protein n=1 Tax=Parvibaculum sp. TaxID=2024848 RepID=UPI002AB87F2A|nr:hypothetical protein [Parvibaculum sp.]MDZ4381473.1 hypothetical protein [Parvibaculum sp.]